MQKFARSLSTAAALVLIGLPAFAQGNSDADTREIETYRLTTQAMAKMEVVLQSIVEQAKKSPVAQAGDDDDGPDMSNASLTETAAAIEKQPMAAAALKKAGFSAREYIVFTFALFQANAFAEMMKSGMMKELPEDANAANVKFVQAHAAEIESLKKMMEEVNKQVGKGS